MIGFSMPRLRRRAKKMMRKKHKKNVSLSMLDKVWSDYVEESVVKPLIKYGSVDIDGRIAFEIVGTDIVNNKSAMNLLSRGLLVKGNMRVKATNLNKNRLGTIYSINCNQVDYKGRLVFEPHRKIKKRVSEHLKNSQQFYKIKA